MSNATVTLTRERLMSAVREVTDHPGILRVAGETTIFPLNQWDAEYNGEVVGCIWTTYSETAGPDEEDVPRDLGFSLDWAIGKAAGLPSYEHAFECGHGRNQDMAEDNQEPNFVKVVDESCPSS